MQRREVLKAFGAATALALLPHEAAAAWARVASGRRPAIGLSDAQLALVGAIGDAIIPRTDSPGAIDVGVPAFVDVIVTENYTDAARATFVAGLDTLATQLQGAGGISFVNQSPESRAVAMGVIEQQANRRTEPARTYWQLKGLVIHGYFTSERVMKDVLHDQVMFSKFEGAAPMKAS